jgi:hypothetical protein
MFTEDWSTHIKIDRNLILNQLNQHFVKIENKLVLRFYTLKPSGTQLLISGLCDILHDALPYYVYGEEDIQKKGEMWAGLNAKTYFGHKNPQTDGKYGELLLFVLVESVLGCKMIAHKIKSLSNNKDQIKGGDGIFLGNYEVNQIHYPAYLIGESKVMGTMGAALKDSMESINRFHDFKNNQGFLDNELIVAKEFLKFTTVDIDELYSRLTPQSESFKQQILVHPVLLMYQTNTFKKLELASTDAASLEKAVDNLLKGKDKLLLDKVVEHLSAYPEIQKVYLDFFILPCNSVDDFRNAMYQKIHGVPYITNKDA